MNPFFRLAVRNVGSNLRWYTGGAATSTKDCKVALVLSGSGVYDGSEIHEASACMVHLSRANCSVKIFAPNRAQHHVVNHLTGKEEAGVTRNVLAESARIARGNVSALTELKATEFDAILFPGGFGVAKNLSNFATAANGAWTVSPDVTSVLRSFVAAHKPIGLCCIAPILAARTFGDRGVRLTLGKSEPRDKWPFADAIGAATSCGAKHEERSVGEICVDDKLRIVTTPAFMCHTDVHEVFDGIGKLVKTLLELARTH